MPVDPENKRFEDQRAWRWYLAGTIFAILLALWVIVLMGTR